MIKIIYAEKRCPGLSREAFSRAWRIHAGDAMKHPDFWDPILYYTQNDAIPDASAIPDVDPTYDCVGEVWYASQPDCTASLAAPSLVPITEDGDHIFSRVDQISMVLDYTMLVDRHHGAIRLFAFIDRPALPALLTAQVAALADADNAFAATVRQAGLGLAVSPAPVRDAVLEFSYDTLAQAVAGHAALTAQVALAPLRPILIATHSYLLYDKRNCD